MFGIGKKEEVVEQKPVWKSMRSLTYRQPYEIMMHGFINPDEYDNMTHKATEELRKKVEQDFAARCSAFQEQILKELKVAYPNLHFERYVDHGGY